MSTEQQDVQVSTEGSILVITLNRPQARNAITLPVAQAIAAAVDELDGNDALAVGIITGADGVFCAGMDLKGFVDGELPQLPGRGFAGIVQAPPAKPLVAAVEGYALAGGFEIALACDLITAGRGARFGIPEVKRGLVAAGGALLRLPERIPPNVATQLALTGEFLDAPRAHELGLVNALVEDGKALDAALDLAAAIAVNGPLAVRASKRIIAEAPGWPREERWTRQEQITDPVFVSHDAIEGASAFAEKRPPNWRGE
ncbi:crotonase/enoyl-CoA hydratase family protein [Dactylosporangium sp. CA-233914]|uniref:crotonase/enoyl-CoA hydratase family protein n=1 Tax=Dactylosporangium sp. CA-233914 TaxID=3239934 RepID=UPI003D8CBBBC